MRAVIGNRFQNRGDIQTGFMLEWCESLRRRKIKHETDLKRLEERGKKEASWRTFAAATREIEGAKLAKEEIDLRKVSAHHLESRGAPAAIMGANPSVEVIFRAITQYEKR